MKINFVSALAGAGKTHQSICIDAARRANEGERILVAMPTKQLMEETERDVLKVAPDTPITRIVLPDGETEGSVVRTLNKKLQEPWMHGELVLCTHAALIRLPVMGFSFSDWSLIIDEVPQIHKFFDLDFDSDLMMLIGATSNSETPFPGYRRFKLKTHPRSLLKLASGQQKNTVTELAWKMRSAHTWVHVPVSCWEAIENGTFTGKKFHAFTTVTPVLVERFQSVHILSANFERSLLHHMWSTNGVKFVEDSAIKRTLQYQEHDGARLTIHYVCVRDWSIKLQKMEYLDGNLHSAIVKKAAAYFGEKRFLWVANKIHGNDLFYGSKNAKKFPNVSHGLNEFSDCDNVIHLSALNPAPAEFGYFNDIGLSPEKAKAAMFYESVYQSVMRCSLRSQAAARPVTVIVMDKSTAEYLRKLFPGSSINRLDWINESHIAQNRPGRKKEHSNSAKRQSAYRARKRALEQHDRFLIDCHNSLVVASGHNLACYEMPITYNKDNVTRYFWGSQFQNKTAKDPNDFFEEENLQDFVAHLRSLSNQAVENKTDRQLISPAYFDPSRSEITSKGNANVVFMRGIWLDHDGSTISPDQFGKLFPNLQMVIFNSFSSTREHPRYRVFIPTATIFNAGTYKTIIAEIWNQLHKAGYPADSKDQVAMKGRWHGFDSGKRYESAQFYLPCQANDPSGNIWIDLTDDPKRKQLDPREWIHKHHKEPATLVAANDDIDPADSSVDWASVERAKLWWRNLPHRPGSGNRTFFKLGLRLKQAGLDRRGIERILREEAVSARSPEKRRKQIPSIMASLQQYRADMSA